MAHVPPTNFHFRPARGDPRKSPDLPSKSLDCRVIGNGLVRAEGDNCLEEGPRTPPEISIFGRPGTIPANPPERTRCDLRPVPASGDVSHASLSRRATPEATDCNETRPGFSGQLWVHDRGIRGSRHRRQQGCLQRDNTRIREQRPTRAASSGSTTGASEAVGIGENACNETIPGFGSKGQHERPALGPPQGHPRQSASARMPATRQYQDSGAKANTSGQLWVHHRRIRGSRHRRHKGCLQLDTTRVRELRPRTRIGVGAGSCGFDCRVSRPSSRHWRWQEVPENQYGPGRAT